MHAGIGVGGVGIEGGSHHPTGFAVGIGALTDEFKPGADDEIALQFV